MTSPLPVVPALQLDPRTHARGLSCVHCGLCLPACPTYTQDGLEEDSPRGRIQLMLGLHDGKIDATESVRKHLDLCLDCRACETACPSNVVYHELIEETRAKLPPAKQSAGDRIVRWVFLHVMTKPTRLKLALLPPRLLQKLGVYGLLRRVGLFRLLPLGLRKMEGMLPAEGKLWERRLPSAAFPPDDAKLRSSDGGPPVWIGSGGYGASAPVAVNFVQTCVGSVMANDVNRKAVELLAAAGCAVAVVSAGHCCGAIHHHNGLHTPAEKLARTLIDDLVPPGGRIPASADAPPVYVVSAVAGCGAMLRDYGMLLRDDPAYAERAAYFASRVRDVTELLAELGLPEMKHSVDATVTYHDACHLCHAQKVAAQPRALLAKVPGLKLVPLAESDMCCGAAGTYNLQHPEMASDLADRKLRHIRATGASVCVAGNVGCSMHLSAAARERGDSVRFIHPVEVLHQAVFGRIGKERS